MSQSTHEPHPQHPSQLSTRAVALDGSPCYTNDPSSGGDLYLTQDPHFVLPKDAAPGSQIVTPLVPATGCSYTGWSGNIWVAGLISCPNATLTILTSLGSFLAAVDSGSSLSVNGAAGPPPDNSQQGNPAPTSQPGAPGKTGNAGQAGGTLTVMIGAQPPSGYAIPTMSADGGIGGQGQNGGTGGPGATGSYYTIGDRGALGGTAGTGGPGGAGGTLTISIAANVQLLGHTANPGIGGQPGNPGIGGAGGPGGPEPSIGPTAAAAQGPQGYSGAAAGVGTTGAPGSIKVTSI